MRFEIEYKPNFLGQPLYDEHSPFVCIMVKSYDNCEVIGYGLSVPPLIDVALECCDRLKIVEAKIYVKDDGGCVYYEKHYMKNNFDWCLTNAAGKQK